MQSDWFKMLLDISGNISVDCNKFVFSNSLMYLVQLENMCIKSKEKIYKESDINLFYVTL